MTAELLNNLKIFLLFVSFISLIFFFIFLAKDSLNPEKPKKRKERSTSLYTYATNNKYTEGSMKHREYRIQLVEKFRKEKIKNLTSNANQETEKTKTTQDEMELLRAAWQRERENRAAFENEKREKNLN